jgi:hypothetical protein
MNTKCTNFRSSHIRHVGRPILNFTTLQGVPNRSEQPNALFHKFIVLQIYKYEPFKAQR